ncbi:MAG: rhodanese-like domain-containing protein [Myxococcales bacterium]|nr:rhodanese-like domain-containing protein [Myxococcales bacterium]
MPDDLRRVSAHEGAALLLEGYAYLDVRTEEEYAAGHPTGAFNVPFMHSGAGRYVPNPEFSAVVAAAFPKDAKLVVGCAAGGRSLKAAQALMAAGHTQVVDLRPGYGGVKNAFGQLVEPGWRAAELPIETVTAGRSYPELRVLASG